MTTEVRALVQQEVSVFKDQLARIEAMLVAGQTNRENTSLQQQTSYEDTTATSNSSRRRPATPADPPHTPPSKRSTRARSVQARKH